MSPYLMFQIDIMHIAAHKTHEEHPYYATPPGVVLLEVVKCKASILCNEYARLTDVVNVGLAHQICGSFRAPYFFFLKLNLVS